MLIARCENNNGKVRLYMNQRAVARCAKIRKEKQKLWK